jgi:hypothetical protein
MCFSRDESNVSESERPGVLRRAMGLFHGKGDLRVTAEA